MERKVKQKVKISDVVVDEDLYPRSMYSNLTAYDYSQSIESGAEFPPIVVAILDKKLYLVDGKHRMEAYKILKRDEIEAEVFVGWNREKIFKEAVRRNVVHGKSLTPFEKRRIALKLKLMKVSDRDVSKLIHVPVSQLDNFIGQRLVNTLTGETIVKSEIKHLAGTDIGSLDVEQKQKFMNTRSQVALLRQVVNLLENDLIDLDNKVVLRLMKKLRKLI